MFTLKGFINIAALKDNTPNILSPVGELSDISNTYARDKQEFSYQDKNVELVAFTTKREGVTISVPATYSDHVLKVSQWIYSQSINSILKNDKEAFIQSFLANYPTLVTSVACGDLVVCKGNWFPSWISWKLENEEVNDITIWFADAAFREGYRDYEIQVVSPIPTVDTFQSIKTHVETALTGFNLPDHHEHILELTDGDPYTYLLSHTYTWHDRDNSQETAKVTWSVVIWGAAGANPTHIKRAYREYILSQSVNPYMDWVKVFPEIFTSTMFTFVPNWTGKGAPNLTDDTALYSPILLPEFINRVDLVFGDDLPEDPLLPDEPPVRTEASYFPTIYKSLAGVMVAGGENDIGYTSIKDIISDYGLIPTASPDFARLSKRTTDWVRLFVNALIMAEQIHNYSIGHDVIVVNSETMLNVKYAVFEVDHIEFRVVTRDSLWEV